jgi:hypothetical protein
VAAPGGPSGWRPDGGEAGNHTINYVVLAIALVLEDSVALIGILLAATGVGLHTTCE